MDTWRTQRRTEGGHMEDKWQAKFGGQLADARCTSTATADPRRTQDGHKADTWWTRRTMADTWRTRLGGAAQFRRAQDGHMADKLRRLCQSISRPGFFSKREPHSKLFGEVNCLGKKRSFSDRLALTSSTLSTSCFPPVKPTCRFEEKNQPSTARVCTFSAMNACNHVEPKKEQNDSIHHRHCSLMTLRHILKLYHL